MPPFPKTLYVTKEHPPVARVAGDEEYLSATGRLEYVDDPVTAVYELRSVGKVAVTETHEFKPARRPKRRADV